MKIYSLGLLIILSPSVTAAHDTWVETNTSLVRIGEIVHIDLKLGNHGNDHRDFKLAGKVGLDSCQISVIDPKGKSVDLKPQLVDMGFTPKEGYWTTRFPTEEAGLYVVTQIAESSRGKTRSIKSAKAYFMASQKRDEIAAVRTAFDKPLGQGLEIVPLANPITDMAAGQPIRIKLFLQSRPLSGVRVSFVPRGAVLEEGFDKKYERETDSEGFASFTLGEGNVVLIVARHSAPAQTGEASESTSYSTTLTVAVPQLRRDENTTTPLR